MACPRVTLQLCSCGRGAPPTTTRTKGRSTVPARPRVVASAPDSHAMAHTSQSRPPQEPGMPLHLVCKACLPRAGCPSGPQGASVGGGGCAARSIFAARTRGTWPARCPRARLCGSGAGRLAGHRQREGGAAPRQVPRTLPVPGDTATGVNGRGTVLKEGRENQAPPGPRRRGAAS